MKRAVLAFLIALGLALPSAARAERTAKPAAGARARQGGRPTTARAAILHAMRSRGVIKPSEKLFANSGIAGGPSLLFSATRVSRRVTRKGARPGETELVNVKGRASPSTRNKSGWTVHMELTPAAPPASR